MMRLTFRPASVKEACKLLNQHQSEAKVIAGGTDLMVQVRDEDKKLAGMKVVIDISHINDLRYIHEEGNIIRIGAIVTHDQIFRSPILKSAAPLLPEACNTVGSPQIRHRGTIGGSIATHLLLQTQYQL